MNLYARLYQAIMENDPIQKCLLTDELFDDWQNQRLTRVNDCPVESIDVPGRPVKPTLVNPRKVPKRSMITELGKKVLLHSFAHIEFNAINLALDAAYRFRDMPDEFVTDWLQVAFEEVKHFKLLNDYLVELGSFYGEFDAHNGLWHMVCKTRHDVLHRMALVPRVMEARGLDVTPGLMNKFSQIGDQTAVDILQVIYQEEIGHVAIGNRWYLYCCDQAELNAQTTFQLLIDEYFGGKLRGPFNRPARLAAGFETDELDELERYL
ncbi:MAG: ferritin-like domain-containing protein [Gammaproteobacteria bacterium]|jgi:uncharacterized ferritin-like protein (DUF455 family)|nr:ferritin-like domain-containing protein [Gammaproteobacteria bacterium]MBT3725595.1 ferritin-like domain-containing protein [Gammaproteobacteria bacterium]MBT6701860.1 ferritin-like domain-containing protein [Gammaproteobacteria bacterium]MBT7045619.1 ferritin-like domain-containing protein [Gammaproteobacteria bacterium]